MRSEKEINWRNVVEELLKLVKEGKSIEIEPDPICGYSLFLTEGCTVIGHTHGSYGDPDMEHMMESFANHILKTGGLSWVLNEEE